MGEDSATGLVGLLLAAGEGRRLGGPKALLVGPDGRTLGARAIDVLRSGGCTRVVVVIGAYADLVREALGTWSGDPAVQLVVAADWAEGQGTSLRTGLSAVAEVRWATAAVIMLVDLPGVGPDAVARVAAGAGPTSLARARYAGRPGHPVVLGRDHWDPLLRTLDPAEGARSYLRSAGTIMIDCDDIADGADVDLIQDADAHHLCWTPSWTAGTP